MAKDAERKATVAFDAPDLQKAGIQFAKWAGLAVAVAVALVAVKIAIWGLR